MKRTQQKLWRLSKTVTWQYIQCPRLGRHQDGRRLANEGNRTEAKRPGGQASILRPVQDHSSQTQRSWGVKQATATLKPSQSQTRVPEERLVPPVTGDQHGISPQDPQTALPGGDTEILKSFLKT